MYVALGMPMRALLSTRIKKFVRTLGMGCEAPIKKFVAALLSSDAFMALAESIQP